MTISRTSETRRWLPASCRPTCATNTWKRSFPSSRAGLDQRTEFIEPARQDIIDAWHLLWRKAHPQRFLDQRRFGAVHFPGCVIEFAREGSRQIERVTPFAHDRGAPE